MKSIDLFTNPRVMALGMFWSRHIPENPTYRLAWWVAGALCRIKPAAYNTVRDNLKQVLGPGAAEATLVRAVRGVFYTLMRTTYELYRAVQRPHEELLRSVEFPPAAQAIVQDVLNSGRGTVLVSLHLSNFDLGAQVFAAHFPGIQLLSLPDPGPGFRVANELRREGGIEVTPLSLAALRQALRRLRAGGGVALMADRPISELDPPVTFFGRPAHMPSGHVRLALQSGAQILIVYCVSAPSGRGYVLHVEPPLEPIRASDEENAVRINVRRVLEILETLIRRWPEQWQMFVPVWPEPAEA